MSDAGEATGRVLSTRHQALITASAISDEVATARGYRSVTTKAELGRLGFTAGQQCVPALLLPIWGVAGDIILYQIRPDEPRIGKDGKPDKYLFPGRSKMVLDVHPQMRDQLGNPTKQLWITEGVRKADAAVSLGLCCIAVLGVWNWRGTNEHGGKTLLADWESIALNGRKVFIAYDSDVMLKPQVHDALARLAAVMQSRHAHVYYVYLPSGSGGSKVGLDDYLADGHSVDELLSLASSDLSRPASDGAQADQPYFVTEAGTFWRKPIDDDTVDVSLANFSAVISDEIVEDDGAEEWRIYGMEAIVRTKPQRIEVPASQFPGMTWASEYLGASAILEPGFGTKDRMRHAIQILSGEIPQCRVYTHTGWRQINGSWVYLHAAGAIGPSGPVSGIAVGLKDELARFSLPDPPEGQDLIDACLSALRLLDLLPPEAAYPLLGVTWLAPLRTLLGPYGPDFVLWLLGPSGAGKSELQALAQAFYGDFTRLTLPVNFTATANAMERYLFETKDALLAIDDFYPTSDPRLQIAMDHVANRLLRGAGNLSSRARMRPDTSLRPPLLPRCLAVVSGERVPTGHSTTARMYTVNVKRDAITLENLLAAQELRHDYPVAMAGYLRYLAARFDALQAALPRRFKDLRAELQVQGSHRREPGQLAHLLLGLETYLDFAVDIGAITADVRAAYLLAARHVLLAQAREHAQVQAEEAPEQVFLRLLSGGFAGKRTYLEDKRGEMPGEAELWGWERSTQVDTMGLEQETWRHPLTAQLVGVLDGEWLLLYPEPLFQFVVGAAKAAGGTFPVDPRTLLRRLDEAGLIAVEIDGSHRRHKVKAWIGGASKRVVKLRRDTIVPPSHAEDREVREEREDPAPAHTELTGALSQIGGKGAAPGKAFPGENAIAMPVLPARPTLPGFGEGGEAIVPEEVVEWWG